MYERTWGNIVLKNPGALCCYLKCNSYIQMFLFLHRSYLGPGQGKPISCIGTLYYFITTLSKSKYFPVKKILYNISHVCLKNFFSLFILHWAEHFNSFLIFRCMPNMWPMHKPTGKAVWGCELWCHVVLCLWGKIKMFINTGFFEKPKEAGRVVRRA